MSVAAAPERLGLARAGRKAAARSHSAAFAGRLLVLLVTATWASSLFLDMTVVVQALTVIGFAAALAGVVNPAAGLMGVAILGALDAVSRVFVFTGGLLRWNTLSYFLLAAAVIGWRSLSRLKGRSIVLFTLFLVLLVMEIPMGTDFDNGLAHVLSLAAILGLLVFVFRGAGQADAWPWLAIVSGVLAAGGGFAFYRHGALGGTINPNAWVYLPLTALLLADVALAVAPASPAARRTIIALSVLNLGWAFLSGSRGGFFVAVIAMTFLVLGGPSSLKSRAGALVALAGAVAVTSLFADLQEEMDKRLTKLVDPARTVANRTSGRSDLAIVGWHVFLEHPLGVGTGGFAAAGEEVGRRENLALYRVRGATQAHSAWIKTLAENGVPGIVLLGAFVFSFGLTGFRRRRDGLLGLGLLTTAILGVSFLSSEFQAKGLWLFVAAVIVMLEARRPRGGARQERHFSTFRADSDGRNPWKTDANDPVSR
jgi:O-Antigen ligase